MTTYLDFEKPIAELESKIAELRHLPNSGDVDIAEEVMRLQDKVQKQLRATYAKLTPWQRVQVARHAERPHAQRYIDRLITDYMPLAGDRAFGEDAAEARGQAEAVATSIDTCLSLGVPLVSVVIGEGGSGGALAIASADRVYMLENSVYSVISPEGCASILWRNNANAQDAAEAMKVTAADLKKLEVIDEVIPEPMGGAHRAPDETIDLVGKVVSEALGELAQFDADTLRKNRQEKFLAMGKKGL